MSPHSELSVVVLAAGLSRRAAPMNKLLISAPDGSGRAVVRAAVEAACGAGCGEVVVVTGYEREQVEAALAGLPVQFVFAADFAGGVGHSLAAGIRAARADAVGFAVVPGDLPELTSPIVQKIADRFITEGGAHHVIPTARGVRGHPVVIGAWLRPPLEALTGDVGARLLLREPAEAMRTVFYEVGDDAILRDVDAPPGHKSSER